MSDFPAYQKLLQRMREISLMEGGAALLSWDEETYMPRKGLAFRAEQLAFVSGWIHRQFTAGEVGDWIKACEDQNFVAGTAAAVNVREWRRHYERQTKVPAELVEEFQRASTLARDDWMEARRRSDFVLFQPHLEKLLTLSRRM